MATEEITKVQELISTSRVELVMAPNVLALNPDMSMRQVKDFMRKKRISGAPVVEGGLIVGIVTMADVIDAMERGRLDSPVTENMTREVKTILKDAPVTEAINNLGREGHGRLPVVDSTGKMVGIVTTGTIMKALLYQMDVSFRKKRT